MLADELGDGTNIPWWFWFLMGEYFVLFMTFPINMYYQYKQKGMFDNAKYPLLPNGGYLKGERNYQWLSLIAKTLLLWQIAGAAWNPDNEYENIQV